MILHPAGLLYRSNFNLITSGLVAYWPLTDDLNDYSGNGWNLTAAGDAAISGGSLALDGVGDWANTPTGISASVSTLPLTLMAWIYKEPGGGGYNDTGDYVGVLTTQKQQVSYYGALLNLSAVTAGNFPISIQMGDGTGDGASDRRTLKTDPICSESAWHHIVAVAEDFDTATFYLDGSLYTGTVTITGTATTMAVNSSLVATVGSNAISGVGTNQYYPLKGNMKDARIYAAALSASQISAIYNGFG